MCSGFAIDDKYLCVKKSCVLNCINCLNKFRDENKDNMIFFTDFNKDIAKDVCSSDKEIVICGYNSDTAIEAVSIMYSSFTDCSPLKVKVDFVNEKLASELTGFILKFNVKIYLYSRFPLSVSEVKRLVGCEGVKKEIGVDLEEKELRKLITNYCNDFVKSVFVLSNLLKELDAKGKELFVVCKKEFYQSNKSILERKLGKFGVLDYIKFDKY